MANTKKKDESAVVAELPRAALKGVLLGIALAALLMLVISALLLTATDPEPLIGWLSAATLLIGAFACGISSVRADSSRSALTGFVSGALYVLVMWLISLFFRGNESEPISSLGLAIGYAACVAASFVGGLLARGSNSKRMRPREGKHSPTALARRQLERH